MFLEFRLHHKVGVSSRDRPCHNQTLVPRCSLHPGFPSFDGTMTETSGKSGKSGTDWDSTRTGMMGNKTNQAGTNSRARWYSLVRLAEIATPSGEHPVGSPHQNAAPDGGIPKRPTRDPRPKSRAIGDP